jgi:hypothetical protein
VSHPKNKLTENSSYLNENYAGMMWVPTEGGTGDTSVQMFESARPNLRVIYSSARNLSISVGEM